MLNRAIRQTYPPGSTFKIVTAAAALDAGVVTDMDAPTEHPGPYVLPGTTHRAAQRGRRAARTRRCGGLPWSCNTVMAKLGVEVGLGGMAGGGGRVRLQRRRT